MGILADSLRHTLNQMREHDEKMLREIDQILDDTKLAIDALKQLDSEIDAMDKQIYGPETGF